MKTAYVILFLITINSCVLSCDNTSKKTSITEKINNDNLHNKLDSLKYKQLFIDHDTTTSIIALLNIFVREKESQSYFSKYKTIINKCDVENYFSLKQNKDEAILSIINYANLKKFDTSILAKKINTWKNDNSLIQAFINAGLREDVFFEKLIYENSQTRHLTIKYIINKEQYWGSLSSEQSCELYFDVLSELNGMSKEERYKFYEDFFKTGFKAKH